MNLNNYRIFEDPAIESIDIRQIYDKFPEKKGGLKELYEKGPQNLFFLVKFWVRDHNIYDLILHVLRGITKIWQIPKDCVFITIHH